MICALVVGLVGGLDALNKKVDDVVWYDTYLYHVKRGVEGSYDWQTAKNDFYQFPYEEPSGKLKDMEHIDMEKAEFGDRHKFTVSSSKPSLLGNYVDLVIMLRGLPIILPIVVIGLFFVGVIVADERFQSKLNRLTADIKQEKLDREQAMRDFDQSKKEEQTKLSQLHIEQRACE